MTITREQLRIIRRVYRLSLAEMAALLGVSESLLCRIERNERRLSKRVAQKVVDEFELTAEKLAQIMAVYDDYDVQRIKGQL